MNFLSAAFDTGERTDAIQYDVDDDGYVDHISGQPAELPQRSYSRRAKLHCLP
jgi:hypothetical protein